MKEARNGTVTVAGHLLLMRKGTGDMVTMQVAFRGYVHEANLEGKVVKSAGGQNHAKGVLEGGMTHLRSKRYRSALRAIAGVTSLNQPIAVAVIAGGES
jgi:hypothetical protein